MAIRSGRVRINTGGSSGGGGAPSGAAGGSLTGTYPNPTIATIPSGATATTQAAADASTKVATTAYTDSGLALKANIASPTLTGSPVLPTGTTGVTQSAADGSTKLATTLYTDTADALKANLAGPTLTGTPAAPTPAANTNTTQLATTAFNVAQAKLYGGCYQIGLGTFSTYYTASASTSTHVANAGDARWARIQIAQSGTLHDVSFMTMTTGGNYNILILDDGQANGTHTTRTCLAIKGATAVPAGGSWMTLDPSLAVNAGDTLVFAITCDGLTAAFACSNGATGTGTLPTTSFLPGSGASTANQKLGGTILSANVPTTTSGGGSTVTDANAPAAAAIPLVVWRIS